MLYGIAASLSGNTTASESHATDTPITTTGTEVTSTNTISPDVMKEADETPAGTTWTEKVKSVLPVGAAAYIRKCLLDPDYHSVEPTYSICSEHQGYDRGCSEASTHW